MPALQSKPVISERGRQLERPHKESLALKDGRSRAGLAASRTLNKCLHTLMSHLARGAAQKHMELNGTRLKTVGSKARWSEKVCKMGLLNRALAVCVPAG